MPADAQTQSPQAPGFPPAPSPGLGEKIGAAPWVVSTYFAEGLPFSIVRQVSSQFLTAMGASLELIGMTSLYGLAWNLKLLWSPLVDRYGSARRWLLATEAALAVVVALLALPAGQGDTGFVFRGLILAALIAATHDIAIDGFYLRALDKRGQAQLSGLRVAAYRCAMLVGNGFLVMLAGKTSWRVAFLAAGGILLALAALHAAWLPRPEEAKPEPVGGAKVRYADAFVTFFRQPGIGLSLAFILLYNLGDSLMFAMSVPFLKSLGFGDFLRGAVGAVGTVASIGGSVAGGVLVGRLGLKRALTPIAIGQSLAIPLYVALSIAQPGAVWVGVVAVSEQLVAGLGNAAFVVFLMRRCSGQHKSAHFAIATALMTIASTLAGYASGRLATRLGYTTFFGIAFSASIPGVVLSRFVPKE